MKEGHQAILQRAVATGLLSESRLDDYEGAEGDQVQTKSKRSKSKKSKHKKPSTSSSTRRMRKPSAKRVVAFGSSSSANVLNQPRTRAAY